MKLTDTCKDFKEGRISKPDFIRTMYEDHHSKLFDYAAYLKQTNIASIEISDDTVSMTSRDKAVLMVQHSTPGKVLHLELETKEG